MKARGKNIAHMFTSVKYASFFLIACLAFLYGPSAYGREFIVKQPSASFSDLTMEHALYGLDRDDGGLQS